MKHILQILQVAFICSWSSLKTITLHGIVKLYSLKEFRVKSLFKYFSTFMLCISVVKNEDL